MTTDTKIGIGIVHCQTHSGGLNIVFQTDYDRWSTLIDDTGDVFRYVKWEDNTILRMIKFVSEGWYMCSMKQPPGRDEEYRASWVYFPSSVKLSQNDIKEIIDVAENQIKDISFDADLLRELPQRYNKIIPDSPKYIIPENQKGFAYRYYDNTGVNLYDLYSCMYQKEFAKYEWVLLMPKDTLTIIENSGIKNISDVKILNSFILSPVNNPDGFVPYLADGSRFVSPIRLMENEGLRITWIKEGYLSISKDVKKQADLELNRTEYRRFFWVDKFLFKDSKTQTPINVKNIQFHVGKEGTDDHGKRYLTLKENEVSNVRFTAEADGYEKDEFGDDFTNKNVNDTIVFEMMPESHHYDFVLKLDPDVVRRKNIDRKELSFSLNSQKKITESDVRSLISGYTCTSSISERGIIVLQPISNVKSDSLVVSTVHASQPEKMSIK